MKTFENAVHKCPFEIQNNMWFELSVSFLQHGDTHSCSITQTQWKYTGVDR